MTGSDTNRPVVALLASKETSPSVLYGLFDVLSTVGAIYPELTTGDSAEPLLEIKVVAAQREPFRCYGNVVVEPDCSVDELDSVDVAIVCDMYQPIDQPPHQGYEREIEWIRRMHDQGAIVASICSGSLILAEAGLLDGIETAGHWCYQDMFRDHYPKVKLRTDLVLCLSSAARGIVTGGSVSSWQELATYLITRLCGPEQAIKSAKIFLLTNHEDGQLPYAVMTPRPQQNDAVVGDCQEWIADHYATAKPVAQMTERAGLNARTFARRFRAATGYHPIDYVHALRVEEAKQLLETSDHSIEEIGHDVGYEDPTSFRRLFKRKAGLTPAAYRRKFARIVAPGLH